MNIGRDRKIWSGIHDLTSAKKVSLCRFAELSGFLPENVKVTNGNHIGLEKNEFFKKILNTIKKQERRTRAF